MENTQEIQEKLAGIFEELRKTFQENPFDFCKEDDIKGFLYGKLRGKFPERVPVRPDHRIELFDATRLPNLSCIRIHTETWLNDKKIDLVVLEKRTQTILPGNSGTAARRFQFPFLIGLEIKYGYGTKSKVISHIKHSVEQHSVIADIQALAEIGSNIQHPYAVFVDHYGKGGGQEGKTSGRQEKIEELWKAQRANKRVGLVYINLDERISIIHRQ